MAQTSRLVKIDQLAELPRALAAADGFAEVLAALQAGRSGTVDGAWGSSSALAAATLARHVPRTLLVVLAHAGDLDAWRRDLASFLGEPPALFPAWDHLPAPQSSPWQGGERGGGLLDEVFGQRLKMLRLLDSPDPPRCILTTIQALIQPVPSRDALARQRRRVKVGDEVRLEDLLSWLLDRGLTRRETVELPGEFSRRGGILDVFPPDAETPFRLEFFGDTVESIRGFAPETQRSLGELQEIEITALSPEDFSAGHEPSAGNADCRTGATPSPPTPLPQEGRGEKQAPRAPLTAYLPARAWVALVEPNDLQEQGKHYLERVPDPRGLYSLPATLQHLLQLPSVAISAMPTASMETTCHLRVESVERFSGEVGKVRDELDTAASNDTVLLACHNEAEQKRLGEVLATSKLIESGRLKLVIGHVRAGFRMLRSQESGVRGQGSGIRGQESGVRDRWHPGS